MPITNSNVIIQQVDSSHWEEQEAIMNECIKRSHIHPSSHAPRVDEDYLQSRPGGGKRRGRGGRGGGQWGGKGGWSVRGGQALLKKNHPHGGPIPLEPYDSPLPEAKESIQKEQGKIKNNSITQQESPYSNSKEHKEGPPEDTQNNNKIPMNNKTTHKVP